MLPLTWFLRRVEEVDRERYCEKVEWDRKEEGCLLKGTVRVLTEKCGKTLTSIPMGYVETLCSPVRLDPVRSTSTSPCLSRQKGVFMSDWGSRPLRPETGGPHPTRRNLREVPEGSNSVKTPVWKCD